MGGAYAVASGKGGVGKTVTTASLGATLAAAGHAVVVVDADLGMANLGGALGIDPDGATVHDVLAEEATVEEATYEGPSGLAVVPGSRDLQAFSQGDPRRLEAVVDALAAEYDYVFVDVGAGLSTDTVVPLGVVDEVLLVSTAGRDALADAEKTERMADRMGTPVSGVVLTRTDDTAAAARSNPNATVLATIPDDPAVDAALAAGEPLPVHAPAAPAAVAYRELARALTGEPIPEPSANGVGDDSAGGTDSEPLYRGGSADGSAGGNASDSSRRGGSVDDSALDEPDGVVIESSAPGDAARSDGSAVGSDEREGADGGVDPDEFPPTADERPTEGDATDDAIEPEESDADEPTNGGLDGGPSRKGDTAVAASGDEGDADDGLIGDERGDEAAGGGRSDDGSEDGDGGGKRGVLGRLFGRL